MTGYVTVRWYRAPEIMLNWMHYDNAGQLPFLNLTHWDLSKIATCLRMTFSNAFSWIILIVFQFKWLWWQWVGGWRKFSYFSKIDSLEFCTFCTNPPPDGHYYLGSIAVQWIILHCGHKFDIMFQALTCFQINKTETSHKHHMNSFQNLCNTSHFNSLWHSDAIWWHRSGSRLSREMESWLTTLSQ